MYDEAKHPVSEPQPPLLFRFGVDDRWVIAAAQSLVQARVWDFVDRHLQAGCGGGRETMVAAWEPNVVADRLVVKFADQRRRHDKARPGQLRHQKRARHR